jgi:hypothetical protein
MILELMARSLSATLSSLGKIALILIPVMVFMEVAQHFKLVDYLSARIEPLVRVLKIPREAAFPLMAGLLLGIIYGAAVILDYSRQGRLKERDLLLVVVFLSINHSIVEDTLIFAALGAHVITLFFFRLLLAIGITRAAAAYLDGKERRNRETSLMS